MVQAHGFSGEGDAFGGYFALYTLKQLAEIVIPIFGILLTLYIIKSFPDIVLKKMGLDDNSVIANIRASEGTLQKGEKYANPIV